MMHFLIATTLFSIALAATIWQPSKQPFLITQQTAAKYAPILRFSPLERAFPSSFEYFLEHATLKSTKDPSFSKSRPSAMDLYVHSDDSYFLELDDDSAARQGPLPEDGVVNAPMYVSAQEFKDTIGITYMFFYPFQPSQVLRVTTPVYSTEFIIESFGEHQGDLERITVHTTKDFKQVVKVEFAHHHDETMYAIGDVVLEGSHVVVKVGMHAHPSYNAKVFTTPFVQTFDYAIKQANTHLYAIDIVGDPEGDRQGVEWRAFDNLVMIGLDDEGKVMGNHPWVAFKGNLGASYPSTAKRVLNVDSSPLPASKEWLVKLAVKLFDSKIPAEFKTSSGPAGWGNRDFIRGVHR
jgi:hypothetical protein